MILAPTYIFDVCVMYVIYWRESVQRTANTVDHAVPKDISPNRSSARGRTRTPETARTDRTDNAGELEVAEVEFSYIDCDENIKIILDCTNAKCERASLEAVSRAH